MNEADSIKIVEFIEVLQPYLKKQKHSMEVLYRLKQHMKTRRCTLLESFESYKSSERFKNTELHPDEYLKVLDSIGFDISEESLYKCLDCFPLSSKETFSYIKFCEAVDFAVNPRAKGMRNLRRFKTEDEIYKYLADQ